jgi:hypothetical protein|tara:strand:+ start:859 stop:1128 length:270 start_codon:yes stop_codon:yes gene_type:complete
MHSTCCRVIGGYKTTVTKVNNAPHTVKAFTLLMNFGLCRNDLDQNYKGQYTYGLFKVFRSSIFIARFILVIVTGVVRINIIDQSIFGID